MSGISFDRAAAYYDETRGYTDGTADRIRDAVVQQTGATSATRFLELGIGTGRIALPFILAGYDYTGIDISQAMMDRLEEKLAAHPAETPYRYELHQGDVTRLPFADNTFDVILVVHVLHLIDAWEQAVREAQRVLRPGGFFLLAHDNAPGESRGPADGETIPPPLQVRGKWFEIHKELGIAQEGRRAQLWRDNTVLGSFLESLGATTEVVQLAEYDRPPLSARMMADRLIRRMYSSDWNTPDDLHTEASRRLNTWLETAGFDPDETLIVKGYFTSIIAHWPTNELTA